MQVALDFTAAVRQVAGVGRHTRSLVSALLDLQPPDLEFTLFYAAGGLASQQLTYLYSLEAKRLPNVRFVRLPFSEPNLTRFWQRLRAPVPLEWVARVDRPFPFFRAPFNKPDIWHFPDFAIPPLRHGKGIVTIHDLSFLITPECADAGLRAYLTKTVPRAVKNADKVIVVSANIKQELLERLQVPSEKIEVVYNGVGAQFQPVADSERLEETRKRLALPANFALFVGTIEPRKNLTRLVEAWAEVKKQLQGVNRKLVLAGRRGWLYEPIFRRITELNMQNDIIWLNFVADNDLSILYNLADLYVFPSLNEGFGISPLESMACGTPVVTANNSALRELFSSAAIMVDAENTASIAEGILTAFASQDGDAKLVNDLREKGFALAKTFTWENSARQTLEIYRSLEKGK
jgi:glycosyltransferase involved in cell wall biosynthesis